MTGQPQATAASDEPVEALVVEEKPSGPPAAALLAGSFAIMILGLLTSLAEADEDAAGSLTFVDRVGPLSGKVIVTICVFFPLWAILTAALWRKNPPFKPVLIAAVFMLALGVLGTFPTFFEALA